MSQYTSTPGTILQIQWQNSAPAQAGCGLMLTLQTLDQGIVNILVDGSTYIPDNHPLQTGEQRTKGRRDGLFENTHIKYL